MNILDLALLLLAVFYLQHVLRWETGPFGVFDRVREGVFGVRIEGTDAVPMRPGTLAELVMCIYCTSFWVAIVLLIGWWLWSPVVWPFAIAGGAALIGGFSGSR